MPSLLALIGSVIVVALIARRDAFVKRRVVRAGLTAVFVTLFVVVLVYFWTTWSWTMLVLRQNFHTERILYGARPVILLHLAADLARVLFAVPWFPSGMIGGIVGFGSGILVGIVRGRRAQATAVVTPVRLPRRALLLGGPVALGLLALPGCCVDGLASSWRCWLFLVGCVSLAYARVKVLAASETGQFGCAFARWGSCCLWRKQWSFAGLGCSAPEVAFHTPQSNQSD